MPWFDKKTREWRFRYTNASGKKTTGSSPSKSLASRGEAAEKDRKFKVKHGLIDMAQLRHAETAKLELTTAVTELVDYMRTSGCTEKTIETIDGRLRKIFKLAGVAQGTVKDGLRQTKQLLNWMVRDGRLPSNPLNSLRPPIITKMVHPHRAASLKELTKIIEASRRKARSGGWPPADREALIVLMCGAGLRRGDCMNLRPDSFNITTNAMVFIEAGESKNRKIAAQPIAEHIVPLLARWLATKAKGSRVFPALTVNSRVSKMIYRCCRAAGIPHKTAEGFLDGHALRHTYGTMMAASGTDIATLKEMMRHSSITTTQRYLHTDGSRKRKAAESLPKMLPPPMGELFRAAMARMAKKSASTARYVYENVPASERRQKGAS